VERPIIREIKPMASLPIESNGAWIVNAFRGADKLGGIFIIRRLKILFEAVRAILFTGAAVKNKY
jgi:hypothetical protein